MKQNEITHVCLVLDASYSMDSYVRDVVQVADNLINHLASNKVEGEEIRITIYDFADTAQCLIYDMDVLRVPSIKNLYRTRGNTALKDATWLAIQDLKMTPEKYGDHAFLLYVLTDGMDNRSRRTNTELTSLLNSLPDHWVTSVFMPAQKYVSYAIQYGFPDYNIQIWDASSKAGFESVGAVIRSTTDAYLSQRRTTGVKTVAKGKSLFTLQLNTLSGSDIVKNLKPLPQNRYALWNIGFKQEIRPFVQDHGHAYVTGKGYYELTKNETIQPNKTFAILYNNRIYTGPEARKLLGLPENGDYAPVKAEKYPDYAVFVQSGSVNRSLIPGQRLLYLF